MRRALAGLGMCGLLAVGVPQCSIIGEPAGWDLKVEPPNMFVNVLKPPYLPIMHASAEVKVTHTPRTFELQAFLWEHVSNRKGFALVRSWKRFKADLPAPGHAKLFEFPDLRKNDKSDDLLTCEPGSYFMMFHAFGTNANGDPQNEHAYFPYNTKKGVAKYSEAPTAKQSWRVVCTKTGQVPNPKGTSPLVLVVGG